MHTSESGPPSAALDGPELIDLLPVGVAQLADDGSVVRLNVALRRMLRLPEDIDPAQGVRRLGWMISRAEGAALLADLVADAGDGSADGLADGPTDGPAGEGRSADGHPTGRLLRLGHVDGTEVWVRAVAHRMRGADPRVAYLVVVTDVTAEHRIREELRKEREQFRILADHAGDVVLVYRQDAIVWASPSVAHVLGRSPTSLLGRTLLDFGVPGATSDLPPLPRPGGSATQRIQLRHADGTLRWFQIKITARQTYGEGPTVYAWLRDIEDQVRAEQALAESERRLRSAFEASPDGWAILVVEPAAGSGPPSLRCALVNARTRDLAGLPDDEIIGHELGEILPADDQVRMRAQVERALTSGQVVTARAPFGIGDETRLYDSFVVALDQNSVLCSWRDVTDIVHAQELLHRAYEETAEMRVTLQTALDATSDGFAVYQIERDADGDVAGLRVLHANAAGAESLGRSYVGVSGRNPR